MASNLKKAAEKGVELAVKNPGTAAVACVMGAGLIVVAAPAAVAAPVLGAVGFSAEGVLAGSIAAGVQGTIGNVVGGSAFAVCQSAAAGGAGAAVVAGATQVAGGAVAVAAGVGRFLLGKKAGV
ncbi:hypothetical protein QBC44DRAFT_335567 [Cladorrhinum sp. PSN332]|nr:hypothetical protein QBC44DRAFT_335567 [Cladorrhinum sp. PSN332]